MATAHLLQALACAHRARQAPPGTARDALLRQLDYQRDWIAARAADCPENFQHMLELIEAERAWVHEDFRAAARAYDTAWQLASERTRFWNRAVILEQAARFRQACGIHRTANLMLQQARTEYAAWGAEAKCAAMGPGSGRRSRALHPGHAPPWLVSQRLDPWRGDRPACDAEGRAGAAIRDRSGPAAG